MAETEWMPIETAPKDGRWLILEVEIGGHIYEPRVGRWNPKEFELGTYEWETIDRPAGGYDESIPASEVFNHYSDGAVVAWLPLPNPPRDPAHSG